MFKLTTIRRGLALALAAILGAVAAVAFSVPTTGGAATATTYSLTVTGSESHTLSPYFGPAFTSHGGVIPVRVDSHDSVNRYFESAFDVPVGAKITSVSIAYAGCSFVGTYTFGSYSLTGNTVSLFSLQPGLSCARKTVTKTGAPITTVAGGRRYVLDWRFTESFLPGYSDATAAAANTFYGATVKYTCTAPCVP
jgi:hypothetical protein